MLKSRRELTRAEALRLWGEMRKPRPCNRAKGVRHGAPFSLGTCSTPQRSDFLLVMAALLDILNRFSPDQVN